jgi:hypothetical protein
MKVSIVRGGGLPGLVKTTTVDSATLSPQDAETLAGMVDEARLHDHPSGDRVGTAEPDRFTFQITVEDGDRQHQVSFEEGSVTPGVRSLISWVASAPGREESVGSPGRG